MSIKTMKQIAHEHHWNNDRTYLLTPNESAFSSLAVHVFGPGVRLGRWHEKPKDGEKIVGYLLVRPSDPRMPVFKTTQGD